MADGAYRWQGTAPAPDAARVGEIDAVWDEAAAESFGETARLTAVERIDRAMAAARTSDMAEASSRLAEARSVLEGLDPRALEPRRGLAGLFDGRAGRLKRFRDQWRRAAAGLSEAASDLSGRIDGAARRSTALDGVWIEIRDALTELDAHLAVATARLSGHTSAEDAPPHPLEARRAALEACRAAALQSLPLIRSAQNTDARASGALKVCADGVSVWTDDWKAALGLSTKRPKKVRPDGARMTEVRDELKAHIDRALAELTAGGSRRAGIETRLATLRRPL